MHFSHKKFLIIAASLSLLLGILFLTTWKLHKEVDTPPTDTLSGSTMKSSATSELLFSDLLSTRLAPLLESLENKYSLLADTTVLRGSARTRSEPLKESNKYMSWSILQVNGYQDALTVKTKVNTELLFKDFIEKSCPLPPLQLSLSGSTINSPLSRRIVMHYSIGSSNIDELRAMSTSIPFRTSKEVAKELSFDTLIPLQSLPQGTYEISATPGCEIQGGTAQVFPDGATGSTFTKKDDALEAYELENNNQSLLKIVSPKVETNTPGQALRELTYTTSLENKISKEVLHIPYIQTSADLRIKAESILPKAMSGSQMGNSYRAEFTLYGAQNNHRAHRVSHVVHAPTEETKVSWDVLFTDLPKDEYTLITRVISRQDVREDILRRSKVEHIGIGDIYFAYGDSTLAGYGGEVLTSPLNSDQEQGRYLAQPTKECEVALAFKKPCDTPTRKLYGYTSSLAKELSTKKNYPVFILNEGLPKETSLSTLTSYLLQEKNPMKDRYHALSPNGILVQISSASISDKQNIQSELLAQEIKAFKDALFILKNSEDIPLSIAIPPYELNSTSSETFAILVKDMLVQAEGVLPGPNLYKLYYEELLSPKSSNLYRQDVYENRYVNSLGLKSIARKWMEYL